MLRFHTISGLFLVKGDYWFTLLLMVCLTTARL